MPSLADLQNIRVVRNPAANMQSRLQAIQLGNNGGMPQGGYSPQGLQFPQGFGGFNSTNIQNMLAAQNQLSQYQREQDARIAQQNIDNARGFSLSGGYDPGPMRQMTGVESGLKKASDFTQGLVNMTGWDPNKGFTPGNILRFGASLPFQMAQGVTEGSEQLYEAATGRPLLQADSETGLIGTNTLDASQRAASLVNAGINIGGLFTGGSARAIGTGANIVSKGKVGARMAEGMFGRAMKSPVGQVAYDVAEEGGEEFVQQYLDDTRMKQLDEGTFGRALEGAKWGALGGGMMSGTSLAVNKALGRKSDTNSYGDDFSGNTDNAENQNGQVTEVQNVRRYHDELRDSGGIVDYMPGTLKELRDRASGNIRRVPGSATLRMSYANPELKRNSVNLSAGGVTSIWQSGADSQAEILQAFRMDPTNEDNRKIFADALYDHKVDNVEYANASEALQALKNKQFGDGAPMVVALGRNPDTKNGGFYLTVNNFFEGEGVEVHPWVAPIIGMDFDGDQSTIYFNTRRTNFLGYPTDMMRSPEGRTGTKGESEADWWFGNMDFEKGQDRSLVKRIITESVYGSNVGEDFLSKIDDWADRFVEASKKGQKGSFSDVLNEISETATESSDDRSGWTARNSMEYILSSFEGGLHARAQEHANDIVAQITEAEEDASRKEKIDLVFQEDGLEDLLNRGSLGNDLRPVQLMKWIGGVTYAITKKGNPIFRQYTIPAFDAKDHEMWISTLENFGRISRNKDTFSALMRASLRIAAAGQTPLDTIEGMIDAAILSRVMQDMTEHGGITSGQDIAFLAESYVKHHDEMVAIYNDAIKVLSNKGLIVPVDETLRNAIESVDSNNFARAFERTFDGVLIEAVFDNDRIPDSCIGMSFGQIIRKIVEDGDGYTTTFDLLMEDSGVSSFINRLIGAYKKSRSGLYSNIDSFLESGVWNKVANKIANYSVDQDGNVIVDQNDHPAIFALLDGLSLLIGPKYSLRAGLYGLEVLNTRLGKMLFSKEASVRKNALICISVNAQFSEAIEYLNSEDRAEQDYGKKLLIEAQYISPLHRIIATDLLHGNYGAFEYFINPEITLGEKESDIANIEILPDNVNIYDLLQTEDSRFAVSGMTRQIKEAANAETRAIKSLFEDEKRDARELKASFAEHGHPISNFSSWLNYTLKYAMCKVDEELLGMEAWASTTIANAAKEKATNFDAATQTWASLELSINGGFMSFIDSIMSVRNGVIDMQDFAANRKIFLKVLSDPSYSIKVVDPVTGDFVIMSRDFLIHTIDENANDLTPDVFFKMLERWPQLAGWLAPSAAQPTLAGGIPSAAHSKTTTLTKSFNDWMDESTGINAGDEQRDFNRQIDLAKQALEVQLLNQPWYRGYLIRCIKDIDNKMSLGTLTSEMKRLHRQAVDGFFSLAIEGKDTSNFLEKRNLFITNLLSAYVGDMNDFVTFSIDNLGEVFINPLTSVNTLYTVSDQIGHAYLYSEISQAFKQAGLKVDLPDGISSISSLIDDDETSNIMQSAEERINEMIDDMRFFMSSFALAIEENPNISFNPDPNELAAILEAIDDTHFSDNKAENDRKKAEAKAIVEEKFGNTYHLFNSVDPDPNIITSDDIKFSYAEPEATKISLYRKMRAIKEAIGEPIKPIGESSNELIQELDDAFDGTPGEIRANLEQLRIIWNNKYFSQRLKAMSAITGESVNSNAYKAMMDFLDNASGFIADMREDIQKRSGLRLDSSLLGRAEYQKTPPTPSFLNETAEGMANNSANMDISGFVEPTVSNNGGMTKQLWAFGYLPSDTMSGIDPTSASFSEIEEMAKNPKKSRWRAVIKTPEMAEFSQIKFSDLTTIGGIVTMVRLNPDLDPNTLDIYYYDPVNNPHGVSDSNTPVAHALEGTGYKRLRGILGRICDFSQEGMVLKAKKNLKSSGTIVAERDITAHRDPSEVLSSDDVSSAQNLYDKMRSFLIGYRNDFSEELKKTFGKGGRAEDLGMDEEQCLILAQALTPGFIVTRVDADGKSTQIVVDASAVFFGADNFTDAFNRMTDNGKASIASIQIMPASLTEVSYKIGRATTAAATDGSTVKDLKTEADKAMNDWNSDSAGTLSVDRIMSEISHVGYSWNSPMVVPDWRTSVQYLMDELHEASSNAYLKTRRWSSDYTIYMKPDHPNLKEGEILGTQIVPKNGSRAKKFVVTRAFFNDESLSEYNPNQRVLAQQLRPFKPNEDGYIEKIDGKVAVTWGMTAICLDPNSVEKALRWGETTGGNVLVRKSVFDSQLLKIDLNRGVGEYTLDFGGHKEDLVLVVPSQDVRIKRRRETGPSGTRSIAKPKDIGCALIDVMRFWNTGDASAIGTEAMDDFHGQVMDRTTLNTSEMFPRGGKRGKVRIATKEEVRELYRKYSNLSDKKARKAKIDLGGTRIQGFSRTEDVFEREFEAYINSISLDKNRQGDGVVIRDTTHGTIVAFAIDDSGIFAPIYLPSKAPLNTDFVNVGMREFDNNIEISWGGSVGFDEEGSSVKVALAHQAGMKLTVRRVDYSVDKKPVIPFEMRNSGKKDGVQTAHLIVNADTQESRLPGFDWNIFVKDGWYALRWLGGSVLFETDASGKVSWRNKKFAATAEGEADANRMTRADLSQSAWNRTWEKVINGSLKLIDGTGNSVEKMNQAIAKVARNCSNYDINFFDAFTTFRIGKNGEKIDTDFDTRFMMLFDGMTQEEVTWYLHAMNPKLIPEPYTKSDPTDPDTRTLLDIYGNTLFIIDGKEYYLPGRWGCHMCIGDQSSLMMPSGEAKYSPQHLYRRGLDIGYNGDDNLDYMDTEWRDAIEYGNFMLGDIDSVRFRRDDQLSREFVARSEKQNDFDMNLLSTSSWQDIRHRWNMNELIRSRGKMRRVYDGKPDDKDSIVSNPSEHPLIKPIYERIRGKYGEHLTWRFIMREVDRQNGYTYTDDAHHQIDISSLKLTLEQIESRLDRGEVPIGLIVDGTKTPKNRYPIAMLYQDEIDIWWSSQRIREQWADKNAFKEAIIDEAEKCYNQIENCDNPSKKKALITAYQVDYESHGMYGKATYVSGGMYLDDIVNIENRLVNAIQGGSVADQLGIDRNIYRDLCARERQALMDIRALADATNYDRFVVRKDERGRAVLKLKSQDGKVISAVLNSAAETSKVMAMLNPAVFGSNLLDRSVHQSITRAAIWLGNHLRFGPYSSKNPPDAKIIEAAVNNQDAVDLFAAMRTAELTGDELELLSIMSDMNAVREWQAKKWSEMTPGQKFAAKVYDIQTGSTKLVKGQLRNFLYRFAQFAEVTPGNEFWVQKNPGELSTFEKMLAQDDGAGAVNFLIEVMGGHNATSPSFTIAQQAMNHAMMGDMAQRNVFAMVLGEACRKSSLCKFIVTTCVSRFPAYSLNVTHRMLNWVLPMSSIYYVMTERIAEHGHNKAAKVDEYVDPHYERAQVHRNLREAMLVDVTHLGFAAVAFILVGMSGGIEPPDDEKKWGNTDEWLIFGHRVGDSWWMEDILGIALPMAAFTKSLQMGKPRMDLLINGVTDACCNNPMIKVADAVGWISDPDGSLISRYERDFEQYQNAKGGPPAITDWMQANSVGFGMNWVSQFFTPSCVREWYQNSQQWERSYKRVYQTNPNGTLSEAGQQGYTEYTTYADAQIRRATRRNPMLGFLADLVLNPTTGYMAGEMPMTVYTDDYQREAGEYWSINGLEPADQQAKILEIICEIQKYDNMDDLIRTGFYLDNETRAALGSTCWDIIHEWDNWYYGLQEDGQLDYYALGNGDFKTGQMIAGSIKKEWLDQKDIWKSFYYDKVQKLPNSIAKYNRYNTTYEKDVYGDIYASGYRPQGVLPFVSAPGTITNPEGTAGYENDFMSISSVTGLPLNQRALVPTEAGGETMPTLEAFSGDGNGSGYSKLYENWYGNDGTTGEGGTLPSGLANSGLPGSNIDTPTVKNSTPQASGSNKTSSSKSSGGRGGYRRRSGGGGGGGGYSSTPNIYARYQAPYAVSANVMGRVNRNRPNFDYLRPSWETKGSREAYKREDI